jgi:DNA-binding CsgD family transcriptional regulator
MALGNEGSLGLSIDMTPFHSNDAPLLCFPMTLGERIRERAAKLGISQAEVGRRADVRQSTINTLVNSNARTTPHLIRLARVLQTSPAYLMGETDDPDEGAPPPVPVPRTQVVMMPVGMPSEDALADMYEAQLRVFAKLSGAELARALAKRLPKALVRLQAAELYEDLDPQHDDDESSPVPTLDRPLAQQSRHR